MKPLQFKSLTFRIWFYFSAMIIIVVALFLLANFFLITRSETENTFRNLQLFKNVILGHLSTDEEMDRQTIESYFRGNESFREIRYFLVKKDNGRLHVPPDELVEEKHPGPPPELFNWLAGHISRAPSKTQFIESFHGRQFFFLISRVPAAEGNLFLITYTQKPDPRHRFYELIFPSLLIILLSLIVSKLLSNNLSKPLKRLELYMERIAKKEWTEPIIPDRDDEIGRLIRSMNQMQKSLKAADEEERTFLQSISHDLKTPVMVIKSYAEAILDGVYLDNLEETARIISNESSKLEHKIHQLIYFNSLDYIMENQKAKTDIKLDLLFNDLYERFKLIRSEIHRELKLHEVSITGNPEQLNIAFENIIENQLRYAETRIAVTINHIENQVMIDLYNDGPQIGENHLPRIFDRFYKEKKGNFGLGLAISKKIIEFYNGTIQAVNRGKGVSFIIHLPASTKPELKKA